MLLGIGEALDLPLRDRNTLLVAAGFAPVFRMSPLEDPAMNHIHHAVEQILRVHEPHPAMLLDRHWNILRMNEGAFRIFQWCGLTVPPGMPLNAYRAVFDPSYGLRSAIVNFEELADIVLRRLRVEADVDTDLRPLLFELTQLRGDSGPEETREHGPNPVALPIRIRKGDQELCYFTTLTTLGTPLDVTAQELRIEGYFPMDQATDRLGRALASSATT